MKQFLELAIAKTVVHSAVQTLCDAHAPVQTIMSLVRGFLGVYADFEGVHAAQLDLLQCVAARADMPMHARVELLAAAPVLLGLREVIMLSFTLSIFICNIQLFYSSSAL